jgi:hypothetical protein
MQDSVNQPFNIQMYCEGTLICWHQFPWSPTNLCFGYKGEINRLKITHDYSKAERRYTEYMNLDLKPAVDK